MYTVLKSTYGTVFNRMYGSWFRKKTIKNKLDQDNM